LIQEIQYDYLGKEVLHVDFLRASATDIIRVVVPIELRGTAPGLKGGGVLIQPLHSIHVECAVANRPESIRVKLDDLQLGQAIHVRELPIPEGVKCLDNPEAVVVQIKTPTAEVAPASPLEGAVEPEVITAKKKDKEEGEE
jgi:large subunit ribosomal protein L25